MRPASKAERRGHGSAFGGRGLDTPDILKIRWGVTISNQALRYFIRPWPFQARVVAPPHPLRRPAGGRRTMTQGVLRVPGDSTREIDLRITIPALNWDNYKTTAAPRIVIF
jgi:hypothetical protein